MYRSMEYKKSDPYFVFEVLGNKDASLIKPGVFLDITCNKGHYHISWLTPEELRGPFTLTGTDYSEVPTMEVGFSGGKPRWIEVGGESYAFPELVWQAVQEFKQWIFG